MGHHHLQLRLGIERDYDAKVFGQGLNFFHIENWYFGFIRGVLRFLGLHGRGRRNARDINCLTNRLTIPHLPESFSGFLLQLTDLHLDMAEDMPGTIAEAVGDVSYDARVMTGDYRAKTYGSIEGALMACGG